ncbi:hypothetical protein [Flammeovirga aprica]|uniref:DUF4382 domain-containing protein n=1 Tax=Flammeovirga aprica JL-4 TaxID=694437 RepID=A0A7X9RV79_9BACT|nr:hypothetical protein [Flammeovirga aprica]NME69321.1 DUF4382 domain-containing protein [Flammeovirga aprica JL-4]
MKKFYALLVVFILLAYACKIYEEEHFILPASGVVIDIQSTGLESKDIRGNTRQAFLDFDSVLINIISFQLSVSGDTLYYPLENKKIDLLSFVSKDTVLWNEVPVKSGKLDRKGILEVELGNNYLVDVNGVKYPLRLEKSGLDFLLFSKTQIEPSSKYGIKLDFMHSLQVTENKDGTYSLSQKKKQYQNGMMFLYPLSTRTEEKGRF